MNRQFYLQTKKRRALRRASEQTLQALTPAATAFSLDDDAWESTLPILMRSDSAATARSLSSSSSSPNLVTAEDAAPSASTTLDSGAVVAGHSNSFPSLTEENDQTRGSQHAPKRRTQLAPKQYQPPARGKATAPTRTLQRTASATQISSTQFVGQLSVAEVQAGYGMGMAVPGGLRRNASTTSGLHRVSTKDNYMMRFIIFLFICFLFILFYLFDELQIISQIDSTSSLFGAVTGSKRTSEGAMAAGQSGRRSFLESSKRRVGSMSSGGSISVASAQFVFTSSSATQSQHISEDSRTMMGEASNPDHSRAGGMTSGMGSHKLARTQSVPRPSSVRNLSSCDDGDSQLFSQLLAKKSSSMKRTNSVHRIV